MQVIRFNWNRNWKPELLLSNQKKMPLLGPAKIYLGKKYCTGYYDTEHHPCPEHVQLTSGRQCASCMEKDIFSNCLGCDGSECTNSQYREKCKNRDYVVYLAAFGDLLKVGISVKYRFKKRFVEQGADFAARIAEVKDGKKARVMEKDISEYLGITDRVWGRQKAELLLSDPNHSVEALRNAYQKLESEFPLTPMKLYDLRSFYDLRLKEKPMWLKIASGTRLKGDIVGAKGGLLFLKGQSLRVLNAHRMIGRLIRK